jgi:hypothetical protein
MKLQVECDKDYQGEESPRSIFFGGRKVVVLEIVDRWIAFDHRYYKVHGDDGGLYILRHEVAPDNWEITLFEQQK